MSNEPSSPPAELPAEWWSALLRDLTIKAHHKLSKEPAGHRLRLEPEDLAQEVVLALAQKHRAGELHTSDRKALVRGLGGTILERRLIDVIRKRREVTAPHADRALAGGAQALQQFPAKRTSEGTKERRSEARAKLDYLTEQEALGKIPKGSYDLFVLHLVDGRSFVEIAEIKGGKPDSHSKRFRRLCARLRKRFGQAPRR